MAQIMHHLSTSFFADTPLGNDEQSGVGDGKYHEPVVAQGGREVAVQHGMGGSLQSAAGTAPSRQ